MWVGDGAGNISAEEEIEPFFYRTAFYFTEQYT